MFFLIKIVESLILPPGIFILIILLLGIYLYKKSKVIANLSALAAILLYLCSTSLIANTLMNSLEARYSPPKSLDGDVLIMLGGGQTLGTPDVNGEGNLTGDGANRLLTTAMLYHTTHLPIILSSGPLYKMDGALTSQSLIAKRQLVNLGVPAKEIITENNSLNTWQNAENTAKILDSHHFTKPVLITSAYHMPRAVDDFRRLGISVIPFPAGYYADRGIGLSFSSFLPSAGALSATETVLKEYLGMAASLVGVRD